MKAAGCFMWLVLMSTSAFGAGTEPSSGSDGGGFDWQLVRQIIREIGSSQTHQFLLAVIKWAVFDALIGLIAAILSIVLFKRLGWYRSQWKYGRPVRWLLYIITVVSCTLFLGIAGFWNGIVRGSEHVLLKSQLGTRVFPEVAGGIADGVAALQVCLSEPNAIARLKEVLPDKVATFRAGEWEVNAPQFVSQLNSVRSDTVSYLLAGIEKDVVARNPWLKHGLANKVLHTTLSVFGAAILQREIDSQMKRQGVDSLYLALRDKLVIEARRQGNPDTISHKELSAFVIKEGIVPAVMKPIRYFAGSHVILFLILSGLSALLPPLVFCATCGRAKATSPTPLITSQTP